MVSELDLVSALDDLLLHGGVLAVELLHEGKCLHVSDYDRVGIGRKELRDIRGVVGLHMLYDQVVGLSSAEDRFQIRHPLIAETNVYGIHDGDLLAHDDIGIVAIPSGTTYCPSNRSTSWSFTPTYLMSFVIFILSSFTDHFIPLQVIPACYDFPKIVPYSCPRIHKLCFLSAEFRRLFRVCRLRRRRSSLPPALSRRHSCPGFSRDASHRYGCRRSLPAPSGTSFRFRTAYTDRPPGCRSG